MSPRPGWPLRCAPRSATPAAAGRSPQPTALDTEETFPAGYRQQVEPNLVRIEAFLTTLARLAALQNRPQLARPAYLTCVALESAARSARTEMLAALVIQ